MRVPQGAREPCERCYTLGAGVNGVTAIMGARQSGKVRKLFAQKHRRLRGGPLLPPAPRRRPAAPRQDAPGALPDLAPSKVAFPQPDWCGWVHCHLTDGSGPPEVCGGVAAPHCFLGGRVTLDARTAGGGPRSSAQPGLHTAARPLRGPSEATSCSIDYDASLFTPISHFSGDSAGYSPNQEQTQYLFLQRARKRTISIRIIFPSSVLRAPKIVLRLPGLVAG